MTTQPLPLVEVTVFCTICNFFILMLTCGHSEAMQCLDAKKYADLLTYEIWLFTLVSKGLQR